ncbi:hypothetical protein GCM10011331_25480 [Flavimobilis marinus]|uniref:Metal-dependent hydrolase, endonuclease/exonuclease/phosphatase family n=1 Tax=Flavimobilis marinus TaxID=285351 RepID=A0A1I2HHG6_9MICO|nr:fibronectin type III domain-containing protein [Flavimobilis marinus]GHG57442.1 hypothetical protein GCM10011331_25480 [Flavimobilis marinus]SFF29099.1 Metal-dependent hydrolase, endonuclease/exonuclease/phosphatase family [Flavimobilis marinus]
MRTAPRPTAPAQRRTALTIAAALTLSLVVPATAASAAPAPAAASTTLAAAPLPSAPLAAKKIKPATPTGIKAKGKTSTSIRVSWKKAARATAYRVSVHSSKWGPAIAKSKRTTRTAVVVKGVKARSADYWVRVTADNKKIKSTTSKPVRANIRPTAVKTVKVTGTSAKGLSVKWSRSKGAQKYQVQVARNASFTSGVKTYNVPVDAGQRFTATSLTPGATYWVRVRGKNATTTGSFSAKSKAPRASTKRSGIVVKAATANLFLANVSSAGESWSVRRKPAASQLSRAGVDIVGVQEATTSTSPFAHGSSTQPQDFANLLSTGGKKFTLARSGQTTMNLRGAVHIIYNSSRFTSKTSWGGRATLSGPTDPKDRWMVWQTLQERSTGQRLFVVNTHLSNGGSSARNKDRAVQASQVVAEIKRRNTANLPVVILGDLNSYYGRTSVTPMSKLEAAGYVSADLFAARQVNDHIASTNKWRTAPLKNGVKVDHIYTSADVAATYFKVLVDTKGGRIQTPIPSDHNFLMATLVLPAR